MSLLLCYGTKLEVVAILNKRRAAVAQTARSRCSVRYYTYSTFISLQLIKGKFNQIKCNLHSVGVIIELDFAIFCGI